MGGRHLKLEAMENKILQRIGDIHW